MKLTKSGVLAISGMLIANSLLLMATTYAATVNPTDKGKYISTDPSHAEQKIESINFIEAEQGKTCSLVLFDISGSMKDCSNPKPDDPNRCSGDKYYKDPVEGSRNKWDAAVSGALTYSENFLLGNDNAQIGLILFGDNAYYGVSNSQTAGKGCMYGQTTCTYGQKLSKNNLDKKNFGFPKEKTYLGRGLKKAQEIFKDNGAKDCSKKIIVIITDGVPNDLSQAKTKAKELSQSGVIIYSLGYKMYGEGATNLGEISKGLFYNADESNVSKIFEKIAGGTYETNRISTENNKLKVVSENLILQSGERIDGINSIDGNSQHSSILGGDSNNIVSSDTSTIIAGEGNSIQISQNSSILGGKLNRIINDGNENNIIMGGYKNTIKNGINSSIPGGSGNTIDGGFSTIVGNSCTITGNYSVAMGYGTKLSGDSSFYRTDLTHNKTALKQSNVFAVLSNSGMVVNTDTAHPKAQLTISGTLIVRENTNDENVVCGYQKGKGILKAVKKSNGETCFCTCDGTNRKSMYNGSCEGLCNPEIQPSCGNSVTLECNENKYVFSGSCNSGKVIDTSYYISTGNRIHWTCQTYDGQTLNCSGSKLTNKAGNCNPKPQPNNPTPPEPNPPKTGLTGECTGGIPDPHSEPAKNSPTIGLEKDTPKELYSESEAQGKPCAYVCKNGYTFIKDASGKSCKEIEGAGECTGLPANAKPNNNETPASDTKYTYSTIISKLCSFQCDNGYEYIDYKNGYQQCIQRGKCTGTIPANAERVTGIPTTGEVEYQLYKTKDEINGRQCAYVCDSNHEYYEDPTTGKKSCIEKTEDNPCGPAAEKTYYNQNKLEGKNDFQIQYKDQLCTYSGHTINGTRAGTPVYAQSSTGEIHWECPKSQNVPVPTVRCYAKQEWCGDGVTQSVEECDNGNSNGKDGECSSTCKKNICTEKKTLKGKCQIGFQLQIDDRTPTLITNNNIIKINADNENLQETYDCEKGNTKTCDGNMEKCSDCENNPKGQRKNSSVNSILSIIKGKGNSGNGISISNKYEYVDWYRNGCPLNISLQGLEEYHLTCNSTFTLKIKSK